MFRLDGWAEAMMSALTWPIRAPKWSIVEADGDTGEADLCRRMLEPIMMRIVAGMCQAIGEGVAYAEIVWDLDEDNLPYIRDVAFRPVETCKPERDRNGRVVGFKQRAFAVGRNIDETFLVANRKAFVYAHDSTTNPTTGKAAIATDAEVDTGTLDGKIVSPLKLARRLAKVLTSYVKTVNGVAPDANGNVTVSGDAGGSDFPPAWVSQSGAGSIFAAFGSGDPTRAAFLQQIAGVLTNQSLSPTGLGTSRAVCVRFRLPKALVVSNVRAFARGTLANCFKFGIYDAGASGSKLWDSGAFSTTSNTWLNLTTGVPFSLAANTDYWFVVATTIASTTAIFNTFPPLPVAAFWGTGTSPLNDPSVGMHQLAQFTVTGGELPATLPTLATIADGPGVPFAWLEGEAS